MNNSNFNQGTSYKQIKEQLDLAITMFDEGTYSASEYETIVNGLKQDFLRLDREKRSRH
ncbi:MAG: hypothetical protein ACE37L_07310 [Allomuricauda sp.]